MEVIENGNLIGSINGTVFGGAGLVAGKIGRSLYTNGINQYVDFGYKGDTCLGSLSLCAHGWATALWVQLLGTNTGTIMDFGMDGHEFVQIYMGSSNYLMARFRHSDKVWGVSHQLLSREGWIHVVATWELCYGPKLYIDGQLVTQVTSPSNPYIRPADMQRFVLGADNNYYSGTLTRFGVCRISFCPGKAGFTWWQLGSSAMAPNCTSMDSWWPRLHHHPILTSALPTCSGSSWVQITIITKRTRWKLMKYV